MKRDGAWFLNVLKVFTGMSYTNSKLFYTKSASNVIIFYENRVGESPKPVILPQRIKVSETFLRGLGIYVGEGTKTRRNVKVINSKPKIIAEALRFFELFSFTPGEIWIQLHENSKKTFSEVKNFWKIECGLDVDKIILKKAIGVGEHKVKPFGVVHLEFRSKILRLFIDGLLANRNIFLKKNLLNL